MNIHLLKAYSVINVSVLRLHPAPGFDIPRARAHAHTLASFPPDGVRGGRTLVCVIGIYMYICDLGHSAADAVSEPVAGSDPTPRSAALRFGVGSLNPGPNRARRGRRGTFTRPVSPRRALRRWGAGRPRVLGRSRSQAERLSSGRRVEARSAPLRSVNTPAPRASLRSEAPTATHLARPARAPSCRGGGRTCRSEAV